MKLLKKYRGIQVIPLYFEDLEGPIAAVDNEGRPVSTEQEVPLLDYSVEHNEGIGMETEGGIESEESEFVPSSEGNDSDASSCPSLVFEDLEDPEDDDIFVDRSPEHGRKVVEMAREYKKSQNKKRAEASRTGEHESRVQQEDWFSDVEMEDAHDEWDDSIDMTTFDLRVGFKFPNCQKFREVIKDWSVRKGYDLKYPKCEGKLITAIYKSGCDWDLRASVVQHTDTFEIKSVKGRHTCAFKTDNTQADYKYLGKRFMEVVKDNPTETVEGLKNKIKRDCEVECSLHKAYRAKRHAISLLNVDVGLQYARLYDYCLTVQNHNPGSSLVIKVNRDLAPPKFQRMYVCFTAMKMAFLSGCRPIICLDGCFLKGLHTGQLLSAVARDENDNMLPIAIAYVEVEKQDIWEWFLSLLFRDIGSPNDNQWSFISNKQKGLLEAINELAPNCEHRFCVKHMYNNFKSKFSGLQLKKLFWKAASSYSVSQHYRTMKEIEKFPMKKGEVETAYEWLCKIPAQHWARCFFPAESKCDVIVNNLCKSLSSYILPARDLAIIDMFEWIRRRIMTRLQVKRVSMEKYKETICPNVVAKIEKQRGFSRNCFPNWSGEDKYEVMQNLENHLVYLKDGYCTCGFFQLCGFPCAHAIACIGYHRLNLEEYVHNFLKKDLYLKVYSHMINPVPGMHDYEDSDKGAIQPPDAKTKRGRPKKLRRVDGND